MEKFEILNYIVSPVVIIWGSFVTSKIIMIDKKVGMIDKLISIIDFDKIPKTKNINELIKTLEG